MGSESMEAMQALESWKDHVMWTTVIRHCGVVLRLPKSLHSRSPQKCWVGSNLVSQRSIVELPWEAAMLTVRSQHHFQGWPVWRPEEIVTASKALAERCLVRTKSAVDTHSNVGQSRKNQSSNLELGKKAKSYRLWRVSVGPGKKTAVNRLVGTTSYLWGYRISCLQQQI